MECSKNNIVCVKKYERKWIRCATVLTLLIRQMVLECVCVCLSVCFRECLPGRISGYMYPAQNRWIDEYPVSPLASSLPSAPLLMALSQNIVLLIQDHRTSTIIYCYIFSCFVTVVKCNNFTHNFHNCNVLYTNTVFLRCGFISKNISAEHYFVFI